MNLLGTRSLTSSTTFSQVRLKLDKVSGKAYRFKVRMTSQIEAGNSSWSEYKILATKLEPQYLKNEYVEIYAKGTGARNHMPSVVKVDNYTLLDHGSFRGLYLIVLDR